MLVNINHENESLQCIEGRAHIVVCLNERGEIDGTFGFINGRFDSSYHVRDGGRLLNRVMPQLLRELRVQLTAVAPVNAPAGQRAEKVS